MPNFTDNTFKFFVSAPKVAEVKKKLGELNKQLEEDYTKLPLLLWGSEDKIAGNYDHRTSPDENVFSYKSPWQPCEALQDQFCLMLSEIDPQICVVNYFIEDGEAYVGVRIAFIEDNELEAVDSVHDFDEEIAELMGPLSEEDEEDINDEMLNKKIELRDKSLARAYEEAVDELPSSANFSKLVLIESL